MIHVVLYEPEIPDNTGNIMRTCVATNSFLHLIEPLGFYVDDYHLKRAGMDYIDQLNWKVHQNYDALLNDLDGEYFYVTRYGNKSSDEFDFKNIKKDIVLVFGKESTGIPLSIMQSQLDHQIRIPMVETARSLNLSNSVSIVLYDVLRQLDYPGLSKSEVIKGSDYHGNDV